MNGSEGDDLLSHRAAPEVPSALADLTAGFGMGPGVAPPLGSPFRPVIDVSESAYALVNSARTLKVEHEPSEAEQTDTRKPSRVSSGQLKTLQPLHLRPIKLVVFQRAYSVARWVISSWRRLPT